MKITVDERYNGRTLLSYLKENGFSHATVSKMKRTENGIAAVYVPEPGRFEFRNLTPGEIGDLLGIIEEA